MNVLFPGVNTRGGFWVAMGLMVLIALAMYGFFRSRKWL